MLMGQAGEDGLGAWVCWVGSADLADWTEVSNRLPWQRCQDEQPGIPREGLCAARQL